ncbi:MAG: hypothetical protein Q7K57_48580 [Burkholderiaceae bacterium]|nr:hypothetical protein [Burkholderiaceae bacterium]
MENQKVRNIANSSAATSNTSTAGSVPHDYDSLTPAQKLGYKFCMEYESLGPVGFAWEDTMATLVYETVVHDSFGSRYLQVAADAGISEQQLIAGIDVFKIIKGQAEAWADILSLTYCKEGDLLNPDIANTDYIDDFISESSEINVLLWEVRQMNPLLYGEICVETGRQVYALHEAAASASVRSSHP